MQEAIGRFEKLVDDSAHLLGADDPNTLAYRSYLARLVGQAGRVKEAIGRLEKLVTDFTRVVGARHPDTLAARSSLAWFVGQAGRVKEAIGLYEALVDDSTHLLGADHPETLIARNNLAGLLGEGAGRTRRLTGTSSSLQTSPRSLGPFTRTRCPPAITTPGL